MREDDLKPRASDMPWKIISIVMIVVFVWVIG